MRLLRLDISAYGRFKDFSLDFESEGAQQPSLHLIFGRNEAGKSTALRAESDLRFGFPKSTDMNFRFEYAELCVSGIFQRANGSRVGLTRLKKTKNDLLSFDPNEPNEKTPVTDPELVNELQAGLDRAEFESMMGIDHARLQEGGRALVQGKGNLGHALFEASAGLTDVKSVVNELEKRAGELFKPRGSTPEMNMAMKTYSDAKIELRRVQVRPEVYDRLNKQHQKAKEVLEEDGQSMQDLRREKDYVTQLRAALPLLERIEFTRADLDAMDDLPQMPSDTRDRRVLAEQGLREANELLQDQQHGLEDLELELSELPPEDSVVHCREHIESLDRDLHHYRGQCQEMAELTIKIQHAQEQLNASAARISETTALSELKQLIPNQADHQLLIELCDKHEQVQSEIQTMEDQLEAIAEQLSIGAAPEAELCEEGFERISQALRESRLLGDVASDLSKLDAQIVANESKLSRYLREGGLDSIGLARRIELIPESTIQETQKKMSRLNEKGQNLCDRQRDAKQAAEWADLEISRLKAGSKVVTQSELQQYRERRDHGWNLIVHRYIERVQSDDLISDIDDFCDGAPLSVAYQRLVSTTDLMADQLQNDTERATQLDQQETIYHRESEHVINLEKEISDLRAGYKAEHEQWKVLLKERNYPQIIEPENVESWHLKLSSIMELTESIEKQKYQRKELESRMVEAGEKLQAALQSQRVRLDNTSLEALLAQADRWVDRFNQQRGAQTEHFRQREKFQAKKNNLEQRKAEIEKVSLVLSQRLEKACQAYLLPEGAGSRVLRQRLSELLELHRQTIDLVELQGKREVQKAWVSQFEQRAEFLAEQLEETLADDLPPWLEAVEHRLKAALKVAEKRDQLQKQIKQMEKARNHAAARAETHQAELNNLMSLAGVRSLGKLEDIENQLARLKTLKFDLQNAEDLLSQTTRFSENELKEQLSDHDQISLDHHLTTLDDKIVAHEEQLENARQAEARARRELEGVDSSDEAAQINEKMVASASRVQNAFQSWSRLIVAQALLKNALTSYQERAQGPMIEAASDFFFVITDGRYKKLIADEEDGSIVLKAKGSDGRILKVDQMSEGTADQLYLALRLAAMKLRSGSRGVMPLVLDDVLITADDQRTACVLRALSQLGEQAQVFLYTHHKHLIDIISEALEPDSYKIHSMELAG